MVRVKQTAIVGTALHAYDRREMGRSPGRLGSAALHGKQRFPPRSNRGVTRRLSHPDPRESEPLWSTGVSGHWVGKGKGSGIEVERPVAHVFTLHDCRIARVELAYTDRAESLKPSGWSRPRHREILRGRCRRSMQAFKRGFEAGTRFDVEAVLEELHLRGGIPLLATELEAEATVYRGHEGVREWLRDSKRPSPSPTWSSRRSATSAIESSRSDASEPVAGKAEPETVTPIAHVVDYKDGKAIRVRSYLDPEEALEAAGLGIGDVGGERRDCDALVRASYKQGRAAGRDAENDGVVPSRGRVERT